MTDRALEAARAHGKEPEPVDWEQACIQADEAAERWSDMYDDLSEKYVHVCEQYLEERNESADWAAKCSDADMEVRRLKDVILRLEQRCAKFEERYPTDMVVKFSESEREKWLRGEWLGDTQDDDTHG